MRRDEIVGYWGRENLRRWSEASVSDVNISASSKSFLTEVGLPMREKWTLRFDTEAETLPRLPNNHNYRRIGYDDMVPLCIDEQGGGRVLAVEEEVGGKCRYINANVECFAECLVIYQQYRSAVRLTAEDQAEALIITTEARMRAADPTAFWNLECWWPVVIEQMRMGML